MAAQLPAPVVAANNNVPKPCDLHEAILANSQSVVELMLQQGADPNVSPPLAPVGVISASPSERARDLHRTLGRVFRSRQGGGIAPLHVAVCNAYHAASTEFGRTAALGIVSSLLAHGANPKETCHGICFCKVGSHPSVTIASTKTADKVALFLKRFPSPNNAEECCSMMDQVATLILSSNDTSSTDEQSSAATTEAQETWRIMLHNEEYADLRFVCPDGTVFAHRAVLAAAVPYFEKALSGPWKEGGINEATDDDASNIREWQTTHSVATMQCVLKFVYTGQVSDDTTTIDAATLLSVASEYQLEALQQHCQDELIQSLVSAKDDPELIVQALQLSHLHNLSSLREASHDVVHENATTLLVHPSMMQLATSHPTIWQSLVEGLQQQRASCCKKRRQEQQDDDCSCNGGPIDDKLCCEHRRQRARLLGHVED